MVSILVSRHCITERPAYWMAGQRIDPTNETSFFVWKMLNPFGYQPLPMDYSNWEIGEPNNWKPFPEADGESCLLNRPEFDYTWSDFQCSTANYFICEYETMVSFGFTGDGHTCSGNVAKTCCESKT